MSKIFTSVGLTARRSFLKCAAFCAVAGPSTLTLAQSGGKGFAALETTALPTRKAAATSLLSIARADQRLIAVGERGIVLLSDDEGVSWRQARVPVNVTLTAVQFVNAKRGWAVGHLGVVLTTSDGGASWSLQLDGTKAAAIVAEQDKSGAGKRFVEDGPDKPFLDLHFENERVGWVVGAYGLALRTEDGGQSWHSVLDRLPNSKGLHFYAIRAVAGSIYLAGEQGLLLRSSNGGARFELLKSPSKGTYFGILSGPAGELLLYGLQGRAFISSDAGASWAEVDTGTRVSLSAGIALPSGQLLLTSQAGELLVSKDGGRSFKPDAVRQALPFTGLAAAGPGQLVATSMRGVSRIDLSAALSK